MANDEIFEKLSILFIDDESVARNFMRKILENLGVAKILEASNGLEAFELLDNEAPDLDLIICDLQMPEMDGYEFVRRLRLGASPNFKKIPVLILSGLQAENDIQLARTLRINGFIPKPPHIGDLQRTIIDAVSGRS